MFRNLSERSVINPQSPVPYRRASLKRCPHRLSLTVIPEDTDMARNRRADLPQLESISRIGAIPIVESSISVGGKIYFRIKESNPLFRWYLSTAESSLQASFEYAQIMVPIFQGPLERIDKILCKSLDAVEQRVPSMYLPPQLMYDNTREYVSSHVVKPVLRRADSVKQLGTAVLDSRVTAFAAESLDKALNRADNLVDKILPPDEQDAVDGPLEQSETSEGDGGRAKAVQTMQHGARFRRKLQRRLTRQALAEAKALKEQMHVLAYVAELIVTDPSQAWQKAREVWASLSKPEPENQASPQTLEQFFVMVTRESARRIVHLINYAANDFPRNAANGLELATHHLLLAAETLAKTLHLDGAKNTVQKEVLTAKDRLNNLIIEVQAQAKSLLDQLAFLIAGNTEREKLPRSRGRMGNHHILDANNILNGVN